MCGSRNFSPVVLKLNDLGNIAGEFYLQTEQTAQTISCISLPNKRFLTLEIFTNQVKIRILDEKGQEQKTLLIPQAKVSGPGSVVSNSIGEIYLTFTSLNEQNQGDIGVMKLNF